MTVMNAKMSAVGSQVMSGSDLIGSSCSDVFGTKDSVNNTVNSQSVADLLPGRPLTSQTFTLRYSIIFNIHVHSPSIRAIQQLLVLFCWRDKHVEPDFFIPWELRLCRSTSPLSNRHFKSSMVSPKKQQFANFNCHVQRSACQVCPSHKKKQKKKQPDKEIKERLPVDSQPVSAGFHMRGTAGGQFP